MESGWAQEIHSNLTKVKRGGLDIGVKAAFDDLLSSLVNAGGQEVIDEFQKSPAAIRNFVANLDTPNWQQHELRRRVGEEVDVIPFGMFEAPEGLRQIRRPFKPQSDPDCGLTVIQVGSEGALRLLLGASWDPLGARGGRLGPSEGFREVSRRP